MLQSLQRLKNYKAVSQEGNLGFIKDVIIKKENLRINFFIIQKKGFFNDKYIVMSPFFLSGVDRENNTLFFNQDFNESKPLGNVLPLDTKKSRPSYVIMDSVFCNNAYWSNSYNSLAFQRDYVRDGQLEQGKMEFICGDDVLGYNVITTKRSMGKVDDVIINTDLKSVSHLLVKRTPYFPESIIDVNHRNKNIYAA